MRNLEGVCVRGPKDKYLLVVLCTTIYAFDPELFNVKFSWGLLNSVGQNMNVAS